MSSQKNRKNYEEKMSSHREKTKDAYIHLRVNSGVKEQIQEYADCHGFSLSEFLLRAATDVITSQENLPKRDHNPKDSVITKNNNKYKTAAHQLIELFDKVFSISFSTRNKNKLLDIVKRTIDTKLIDKVKEEMDSK